LQEHKTRSQVQMAKSATHIFTQLTATLLTGDLSGILAIHP